MSILPFSLSCAEAIMHAEVVVVAAVVVMRIVHGSAHIRRPGPARSAPASPVQRAGKCSKELVRSRAMTGRRSEGCPSESREQLLVDRAAHARLRLGERLQVVHLSDTAPGASNEATSPEFEAHEAGSTLSCESRTSASCRPSITCGQARTSS